MTPRQISTFRGSEGYTLVELLAVVAIMALAASIALPYVAGRTSDAIRLDAAVRLFTGAIRTTRSDAILRNSEMLLTIDADRRILTSPALSQRFFAADVITQMKVAEPERETPARARIRFFPDGT